MVERSTSDAWVDTSNVSEMEETEIGTIDFTLSDVPRDAVSPTTMCSEERLREVAADHSDFYELSGVYEANVMLLGNNYEALGVNLRDVEGLCELQGNNATRRLKWNPGKNQTGQDIGVQSNVTREVEYSHVGAEEPTRFEGGPADKVFDPGGGETMKGEISLLMDGQYLEEPGLVRCYASI